MKKDGDNEWLPEPTKPGIWVYGCPGGEVNYAAIVNCVAPGIQYDPKYRYKFVAELGDSSVPDDRRWHRPQVLRPGLWWMRPASDVTKTALINTYHYTTVANCNLEYAYAGPLPPEPPENK